MDKSQIETLFTQQSTTYDQQWAKLSAFREGLLMLVAARFSSLPREARILCVGAGTGAEIHFLADRFPGWSFVAVEPAAGMVQAGRARAEQNGYGGRCAFHHGHLDSLPEGEPFDGATCFLVPQFILDAGERVDFFRQIAHRLQAGGLLASSDLAGDAGAAGFDDLLQAWMRTMASADLTAQRMQQMREAYARDVAILPPGQVAALLQAGGFGPPVPFYQAGLIHGWFAARGDGVTGGARETRQDSIEKA